MQNKDLTTVVRVPVRKPKKWFSGLGKLDWFAVASLNCISSVTATAKANHHAKSQILVSAKITAFGIGRPQCFLNDVSTITATPNVSHKANCSLNVASTVSPLGGIVRNVNCSLNNTSAVSAAGSTAHNIAIIMSNNANGIIICTGTHNAACPLASTSTLAANGSEFPNSGSQCSIHVSATTTASPNINYSSRSSLNSACIVIARANAAKFIACSITDASTTAAKAKANHGAVGSLDGICVFTAVGNTSKFNTCSITDASILAAKGIAIHNANIIVGCNSNIVANGSKIPANSAACSCFVSTSVSFKASVNRNSASNLSCSSIVGANSNTAKFSACSIQDASTLTANVNTSVNSVGSLYCVSKTINVGTVSDNAFANCRSNSRLNLSPTINRNASSSLNCITTINTSPPARFIINGSANLNCYPICKGFALIIESNCEPNQQYACHIINSDTLCTKTIYVYAQYQAGINNTGAIIPAITVCQLKNAGVLV